MTPDQRAFLEIARTATLATIDPEGRPRLVPICFVFADEDEGPVLYTPLDEKPKRATDPLALARVRDIGARPEVSLLVDRWSEDWGELAWLRCSGRAALVAEGPASVIAALRAKHPQYEAHDLEGRPMIRIELEAVTSWGIDPE